MLLCRDSHYKNSHIIHYFNDNDNEHCEPSALLIDHNPEYETVHPAPNNDHNSNRHNDHDRNRDPVRNGT